MLTVNIQNRDRDVKCPNTQITLFDIKNAYIATGALVPELIEPLFQLVDFSIDRLIYTESERFRNIY